jgi:hypothetical protein
MTKSPKKPGESGPDTYEVGYGKPPKHSQFQGGRSGNPGGRRKGVRNLMSDVKRTLKTPVKVKANGRSRNVSTQEGVLMLLREKALRGDRRSLDRLLELAIRFNNEISDIGLGPALSVDDQAILDAYTAEIRNTSMEAPTTPTRANQGARGRPRQEGKKNR